MQNDPSALCTLGYYYEHGIGCQKDEKKAFLYYQKSSDLALSKGNSQSWILL